MLTVGCRRRLALSVLLTLGAPAMAQRVVQEPHIGYVYPAGGQAGTQVTVTIGGQYVQNASGLYISGQGVTAVITSYSIHYTKLYDVQGNPALARAKVTLDTNPTSIPSFRSFTYLVTKEGDKSVINLRCRITSYNVCYTKLLRSWPSLAEPGQV